MCWGFITGKAASSFLHVKINPYLILFVSVLPDLDLLLGVFGIQHRTWTHSVFLWSIIFIPFFIKYRQTSLPYFISVIQHILLGDSIVGRNTPFYPISNFNFTLGFNITSPQGIFAEAIGFAIFIIWILKSSDAKRAFFTKEGNRKDILWNVLAIIPLLGFVLLIYSYNLSASLLVNYDVIQPSKLVSGIPSLTQNPLFMFEMALHIALLSFLSFTLFYKFRSSNNKRTTVTPDSAL